MRMMKWLAILLAGAVIASCFFPWVIIESKNITIGGFYSTTPVYGEPGLFHVVLLSICVLLLLINRNWSLRTAFFVGAFNIAWAVRNFIKISGCEAGECPVKQPALYVVLIASLLLPVAILFVSGNERNKGIAR